MREPEWVLKVSLVRFQGNKGYAQELTSSSQVAWKLGVDVAWPLQFNRVRFPKL